MGDDSGKCRLGEGKARVRGVEKEGVDNTKGGWAQTSPPLAFWSLPIGLT